MMVILMGVRESGQKVNDTHRVTQKNMFKGKDNLSSDKREALNNNKLHGKKEEKIKSKPKRRQARWWLLPPDWSPVNSPAPQLQTNHPCQNISGQLQLKPIKSQDRIPAHSVF